MEQALSTACVEPLPGALDASSWQAILDRHRDLFDDADPAMCIALVPRHLTAEDGSRRSVVQRRCDPAPMLAWHRESQRMVARERVFRGLDGLAADLLFVGNEGAFEAVLARAEDNAFGEMKRRIAAGAIQLFVLRSRDALRALGYEDFLDLLGLPFLGACR